MEIFETLGISKKERMSQKLEVVCNLDIPRDE
jgi:hypothetical protein